VHVNHVSHDHLQHWCLLLLLLLLLQSKLGE
jgi:hypothetical protein